MVLKVDTFCWFLGLRKGCIIIGILEILFAIISIAISMERLDSAIIGLTLSILGNGFLIFAVLYASGKTRIRSIAVLFYFLLLFSNAFVFFIGTIIKCVSVDGASGTEEDYKSTIHRIYVRALVMCLVWIFFHLYFALVALSFYQELNKENILH